MLRRKFKGQEQVRERNRAPLKIFLFILIGLTAVIFTSVVVGAIMSHWPDGGPSSRVGDIPEPEIGDILDVGDIPEQAVRDLLDEDGNIVDPNQRTAKIAEEHRGGYGGYYFDETDRAVAYVYMLDPSDAGAAEEVFRDVYRGNRQITRILPVPGNYAYSDLLRWFHAPDKAMVGEGIYPEYGGVLQLSNHVGFGLADMRQEQDARGLMRELDIPQGDVVFKEGDNQLLGLGTTLEDALQPIGELRGGGYRSGYRSYPWRHPTGR